MVNYSEKQALIIEDFAEYARAVGTMLRSMGVNYADTVTSGEAAIQACREKKYDIILSDYNLGENKDGQQVLEELSAFNLIKSDCTFIMITAEKTAAMVMAAIEFQPDAYLTKPFNSQLLRSRLDKSITKKLTLAPIKKKMGKRDWKRACDLCDSIANEHPKYRTDCLKLKLSCLKQAKRFDQAYDLIEEILNRRATPWALAGLGKIYLENGKLENAKNTFIQMTNEFPMALDGYDLLAKVLHLLDQPVDAQKALQKAIEKSPKMVKRQKYLGQLAEQNNDIETMTKAYRHAVKFGQNSAFLEADEYVKLTKSLGKTLISNLNEDRGKIVIEAELLFDQLEKNFKNDSSVQFRGEVAHADFSNIIKDKRGKEKHLSNAEKLYDRIEDYLGPDESIEIAETLKDLGLQQLSECVIEEAVEQYFDDPELVRKATALTNNKHLIMNAKKANKLNSEAVKLFKQNNYAVSITYFQKAAEIAPNNVNICLNHAQALLKQYQSGEKDPDYLYRSESILGEITRLPVTDTRYSRFSELNRLNQLMLQKLE
jgi:DNA-binding response OmpR family regulator